MIYVLNIVMVCIDIILTLRNKALDHMADKKAEKERLEREKLEQEKLERERLAAQKAEVGKELAE